MPHGRIPSSSQYAPHYSSSSYDRPSTSSAPIPIGGARTRSSAIDMPTSSRRRDRYESASESESENEAPRRSKPKHRPRQDPPSNMGIYHHTTRPSNRPSIARDGLIRGGGPNHHGGIGDPDTRRPISEAVFVSAPGTHIRDGMGGSVMVASTRPPQRDPLYPGGGAGMFYEDVPPMRNAWRDPSISTASATFPMTPHTASGAAAMLRHHEQRHLTPQQAAGAMYNGFHNGFPIHAPYPDDQNQYYTPQSQFQPHPSQVPAFSPLSPPGYSSPYSGPTTGPIGGFTPPNPQFWPRDR